ncbi:UNKNOWN [Stylonychia lemnae]|uniref:Uncharacterized protein n=1 Tax=Stylonychia lemnae TaxID=5949 RepID=A0A078ACG5_STYLE|nr:UNKNOWN [Stylonychia lemnae]|eukprot:CDW79551.1 UNKNOWN [Stylonychia lemnae]
MRTAQTENTQQHTYLTFSQEPSMMNTPIELIEDDIYSEIIPQFQVDTTNNTFNNTRVIEEKKQRRMEKQNKIEDFFNNLLSKASSLLKLIRKGDCFFVNEKTKIKFAATI